MRISAGRGQVDAFKAIAQQISMLLRIESSDLRERPLWHKLRIFFVAIADIEHYHVAACFHHHLSRVNSTYTGPDNYYVIYFVAHARLAISHSGTPTVSLPTLMITRDKSNQT